MVAALYRDSQMPWRGFRSASASVLVTTPASLNSDVKVDSTKPSLSAIAAGRGHLTVRLPSVWDPLAEVTSTAGDTVRCQP